MKSIESFTGQYRWCSNFYPSPINVDGVVWPTLEHPFQAFKTLDSAARLRILRAPTPGQAKRLGRAVELRPGWDDMRIEVMERLVRAKFDQHPDLAEKLIATGDAELVEGNTWGDQFWGVCRGHGSNHLGLILMRVRDEIREENS